MNRQIITPMISILLLSVSSLGCHDHIATIPVVESSQNRGTETPNERFYRKGGKETKAAIIVNDDGSLTASDIAQHRDLAIFEDGGHLDCRSEMVLASGMSAPEFRPESCDLPKLRDFVWQNWQTKKRGYIRITFASVDAVSTSHLFIEPDNRGQWHIAWRIARHNNLITDIPDIRSLRQRPATDSDVYCRCKPGAIVLSFIDWQGEEIQML
jgi:hypothetical protein